MLLFVNRFFENIWIKRKDPCGIAPQGKDKNMPKNINTSNQGKRNFMSLIAFILYHVSSLLSILFREIIENIFGK